MSKLVDRYNNQKGKNTNHLQAAEDPIDNLINSNLRARERYREYLDQQKKKEIDQQIEKEIKEAVDKQVKQVIEQTFKDLFK